MERIMIILSITVYFILLMVLVLNIEEKSNTIKYSFMIFIMSLIAAFFLVNELVMDYLISYMIRYFYFPTFSSIILTILATMTIFLFSVFRDNMNSKKRIFNYVFASWIFIGYIELMLTGVDINSYNSLYSGNNLILLRYITRTFLIWISLWLGIKYYEYFIDRR